MPFGCFSAHPDHDDNWYRWLCYNDLSMKYRTQQKGLIWYKNGNTTSLIQHCKSRHINAFTSFTQYVSRKIEKDQESTPDYGRKLKKRVKIDNNGQSKQASIINTYIHSSRPYRKKSEKQQRYEDSLCRLTAKALTPLALCEITSYREHIWLLDPRMNPVSQLQLTQTLIPEMFTKVQKDAIKLLLHTKCVSLAYDLWMTRKTEEMFSIQAYYKMGNNVYSIIYIGMPHSNSGTSGVQLAVEVWGTLNTFNISKKAVIITSDGGGNLRTCKNSLET